MKRLITYALILVVTITGSINLVLAEEAITLNYTGNTELHADFNVNIDSTNPNFPKFKFDAAAYDFAANIGKTIIYDLTGYNFTKGNASDVDKGMTLESANNLTLTVKNDGVEVKLDDYVYLISESKGIIGLVNDELRLVNIWSLSDNKNVPLHQQWIISGQAINSTLGINITRKEFYKNVLYQEEEMINEAVVNEFIPTNLTTYLWNRLEFIENSKITITFDSKGGNQIDPIVKDIVDNNKVSFETLGLSLPSPIKEGFDFVKWAYKNQFDVMQTFTQATLFNSNITLTAIYIAAEDSYYFTFNPNGATDEYWSNKGQYGTPIIVDRNSTLSKPLEIPFKRGHKFMGWSTSINRYIAYDFNTPIIKNTTVTAYFEKLEGATVNFVTNGGSMSNNPGVYQFGRTIEYERPEKSRHGFLGWFLDEALTVEAPKILSVDKPDDYEITLYAKWQDNSGTLYFETNGGSKMSPIVVEIGQRVVLPEHPPYRQGYIFKGWYQDEQLTKLVPDFYEFTETTTIHVGWESDPDYKGSFLDSEDNSLLLYISIGVLGLGLIAVLFTPSKRRW